MKASFRPVAIFLAAIIVLRIVDAPLRLALPIIVALAFAILDRRVATRVVVVGSPFAILGLVYENAPLTLSQQNWVAAAFFSSAFVLVIVGLVLHLRRLREVTRVVQEIRQIALLTISGGDSGSVRR